MNTKIPEYFCIVLSAGKGSRFGSDVPKQYLKINQKTVLEQATNTIADAMKAKELLMVHAQDDPIIKTLNFNAKVQYVEGGKERMHSVFNGLKTLKNKAQAQDFVLIHDGARPCISKTDILNLVTQTKTHSVGGVLACPVTNTLKLADENLNIKKTVARDSLWAVQTPQLLRFGILYTALEKAITEGLHVTDDASAVELQGFQPLLVKGSNTNIKITYPEDLKIASFFLQDL